MPGQPKTTAKRVTEIEARLLSAALDLLAACPRAYRNPDRTSRWPIGRAWAAALGQAEAAVLAVEQLADLLRARAAVTAPGPVARWRASQADAGEPDAANATGPPSGADLGPDRSDGPAPAKDGAPPWGANASAAHGCGARAREP